ncbi:TetR family transcriptional regulator [Paenibacillus sp. CAA11]|uniref:TetR/AcrR family transcriptional regulator n=1 Tax=Paenibacillus sp. CAA11 TaxID=1532905 RepID=UPI000D35CF21|nr:TetR/AcrR family transcriptional regulator [Paenibacillus sp. CAA11]AWB46387.1 TetR family transcriptional regulator [Paenibacillus sp. CAA11]
MDKARGEKGRRSKERLLRAAASEFALQGFHGTKISSIVAQAGLTQPSFYLYFASKEAIYEELVGEFRSRFKELITRSRLEAGIQTEHLPARIKAGLERIFSFFILHGDLTRIGLRAAGEADEIKAEIAEMMQENLIVEQEAGYFRNDLDMEIASAALMGVIEQLTFTYLLTGYKDASSLAGQVVEIFFNGMMATDE